MSEPIIVPFNSDAEESLLGAILLDPSWMDYISLRPDDFYIQRYRWIYKAMLSVKNSGLEIDYLTVANELDRIGVLGEVGGSSALINLLSRVTAFDHADSYAEIIRQHATNRRHLEIANRIAKQAYDGGVDVASIIEALSANTRTDQDGRHISEGLSQLYDDVMARTSNQQDTWGINTGFIDFDKRTGGLHKQQVVLVSGDPGVGKTTLMLQKALNAAKSGHGVAIFEEEMDEQRCLRRLVEIESGVTNREMQTGRIPDYKDSLFAAAIERLSSLPIWINDDPSISTAEMRAVLARVKTKMQIDAVFLDYLGLLSDRTEGGKDDWDQTKAKRFRALCRELDLAGYSVQDMTKEGIKAGIPQLADMGGGAKVHFGADWVFFLVKDANVEGKYFLAPAKQRDGDQGSAPIPLTRDGLVFRNAATM